MKIAVVGGGSTYTPELVDGLAALPVTELTLTDPAADRLAVVGALAARMFAKAGHPGTVRWTTDLSDAVEGASAVLLQLRVGGQRARLADETWPLECGCVGQETTGAGGLAKALRTVPQVLRIAERVRELAPGAWIVDFTNPVGIVTRALLDAGHRTVGLCNVAIGFQRLFARLLGVAPAELTLDHVGLNHLTWERAAWVNGADRLPELLGGHPEEITEETELPADLVRGLGMVPSYYLRYYYTHDEVVAEQRSGPKRAEQVLDLERRLLAMYPDLSEKPALLEQRGGAHYSTAAVDLLTSLLDDRGDTQVVNLRNGGTLPFLPDSAVIEVPARITAAGPVPLPVRPVEPLLSGLIAHVTGYEELALSAALHGGRARVEAALLAHPLVGRYDLARRLTDRLLAANREHLPWAA
ncbi:6-phospho-beta-glucosidase [Spongiactinospora gelatinilytica]|uniref:6-phospho-beta-glucosidase n=1 Tax=Spongiactinospora gelatinilytica TaxID=2666298 RepID=A0A2W2HL68_9ACTN|nr:6-phospho-beta-glucosidase [Spongiactinospora gelatinilytica]PZG50488.1 6-phospho-beta-glucosidase [Spongiactinospora gelatinilytica]